MQINILEGRAGYVLMDRVSVTISYSFRCLTTETVKYTNEKQFYCIYIYAFSRCFIQSDLQCIQAMHFLSVCVFYREFSFIKIQYVGTERETNVIINVHFACSEEELPCVQKCKQVGVSKLLSAKKEVMGTWYFFFHVSNRHEQVL